MKNIKWFLKRLLGRIEFIEVPAPNNWEGVPPPNLTWKEVVKKTEKFIVPFTQWIIPRECPVCGGVLRGYLSDYDMDIQQYMVSGVYCPKGHYTNLTFA